MNNNNIFINLFFAFFIVFFISSLSWSASFDCSEAKTPIEKAICADPIVSKLDYELSDAYHEAIESADQPLTVKKSQKYWIAEIRQKCTSSQCLANAYRKRITELKSVKKYSWKLFHDKKLKIEFIHPSNRSVIVNYGQKTISIEKQIGGISMPNSRHIINFEIHSGDFDKAVSESNIFENRDGVWYADIGRFQNPPADSISGQGWKGIKTIITCGIDDELGFHAAGGECLWAIISNGKRYIVANTDGILGTDDNTLKTLMSIKFLP